MGRNIGWINFSPATGGVLNDGYGNLSGYAWGENVGWINFAPITSVVWIDPDGNFNGYVWGENIGWINFAPTGGGVKTSWRPNDYCSKAKEITVFDYTDTMDTTTATTAVDDPAICAGSKGNTVWYKFTAPANGTVTSDTIGSDHDTVLAAYNGTCGNFSSVSCDDDGGGNLTSLITFNVTAGTTYYFMAAGYYNPGGGQLSFSFLYNQCTTVYYQDFDSDGYGNPSVTTTACTQPSGYVTNNTNCADNNAAIHPGAIEACDNIDNNCDGQTDEGLPMTSWYRDNEGDGYGNPSIRQDSCGETSGYVANNTDCNDNDQYIYPGGPEVRIVSPLTYYSISQLQTAYNAAGTGAIIQSKVATYTGNLSIDQNKAVTISGGYDCGYSTVNGKTTISGNITISNGTSTIENVKVQ